MRWRTGLRTKILLNVLLAFCLLMPFLVFMLGYNFENLSRDLVLRHNREIAAITAARIGNETQWQVRQLYELVAHGEADDLNPVHLQEAARVHRRSLYVFDAGLAFFDSEGRCIWREGESKATSLTLPIFDAIQRDRNARISNIFRLPDSQGDVFAMGVPLFDGQRVFCGVLAGFVTLDFSMLEAEYATALEMRRGMSGYAYLVDGAGHILHHRQLSRKGTSLAALEPVIEVNGGKTGSLLSQDDGGILFACGYAPVPGTPWGVVVQEEWGRIQNQMRRYVLYAIAALLVGGTVLFFFTLWRVGRNLRPVYELMEGARAIAGGRFDYRLQSSSGDEIQELAEQFNTMAQELGVSYRRLEDEIEEHRRAEVSLRESEERFRVLVEQAPDAILTYDVERGCFVDANTNAEILFGCSREELREVEPERFYLSDRTEGAVSASPSFRKACEETLAGSPSLFERTIRNAQGRNLICEERLSRLPSGDRGLIRVSYLDITERKHAEAERKKLQAQQLQSEKKEAVGQLAGGVAHDFNNLLTVILGYGELIVTDLPNDSPLRDSIEEIAAAGRRAQDLTRQLLAFSRKQVLEVKNVSLNDVVANMEKMIRRLLGEDIAVYLNLNADTGCVRADVTQIEQVLLNLCVNARDAMPSGGTLTIETHPFFFSEAYVARHPGTQPGPHAVLSVSDTGHGMDETTLRQIFNPFFSTKEKGKGTGLGLATVHGIVKQHGGEITVYSEPGHGTTFKVSLPQVPNMVCADGLPPDEEIVPGKGETILVVEDDESVRKVLPQLLERLGYSVRVAGSVEEGLDEVNSSRHIDLLLSDVVMPQMNGRQFSERVQSIRPGIKVLFMSGYTEEAIGHQGILESGLHFISKPFSEKALSRKIREALAD